MTVTKSVTVTFRGRKKFEVKDDSHKGRDSHLSGKEESQHRGYKARKVTVTLFVTVTFERQG